MEVIKIGFGVVTETPDNGTSTRHSFVTMTYERSGKYVLKIRKLKHDDTRSKKCDCSFKLRRYCKVGDQWRFNVVYDISY